MTHTIDKQPTIILASTSESRLNILRSAGIEPIVIASHVCEDTIRRRLANHSADYIVEQLALAKAQAIISQALLPDNTTDPGKTYIIIGADSMLAIDGVLQGKPKTIEEATRRWYNQRGHTAELITGHALIYVDGHTNTHTNTQDNTQGGKNRSYTKVSRTCIHFANISKCDIDAYVATGEPLECAGAFTLEALGGWFIDAIDGDPSSVIGLSLPVLRHGFAHFGWPVSALWNRTASMRAIASRATRS